MTQVTEPVPCLPESLPDGPADADAWPLPRRIDVVDRIVPCICKAVRLHRIRRTLNRISLAPAQLLRPVVAQSHLVEAGWVLVGARVPPRVGDCAVDAGGAVGPVGVGVADVAVRVRQ